MTFDLESVADPEGARGQSSPTLWGSIFEEDFLRRWGIF
jgi:hypothetical protein